MTTINKPMPKTFNHEDVSSVFRSSNRPQNPNALSASLTIGWRALLKLKHGPMLLLDVTMFPILMTLMFAYIFGGALAGSVEDYIQEMLPGMLVITVSMISMYTAIGLNNDIAKGIFDRFRTLPFWRPAVLVGSLIGDLARYSLASGVVLGLGLIIGFEPAAGIQGVLIALVLLMIFAFSLSWIWTTIGLLVDDAEAVMMVSQMVTFPLTFMSNVFVDPETMPDIVQSLVKINPVSLVADASRGAMHGTLVVEDVIYVMISSTVLFVIFAPLTMYLYNNKNTR